MRHQLNRLLVGANDRETWIIRAMIDCQYLLHRGDESGILLRWDAPHRFKPRFELVFFERVPRYHWRLFRLPPVRSTCPPEVATSSVIDHLAQSSKQVWSELLLSCRRESVALEASVAFCAQANSAVRVRTPACANFRLSESLSLIHI